MRFSKPHQPSASMAKKSKAQLMADELEALEVGMAITISCDTDDFPPNVRATVSNAGKIFSPTRYFSTRLISDTEIEVIRRGAR